MTTKVKSFADEYFGATKSFISKDGDKRIRFCPCLLGLHSDPLAAMFSDEFKEKDENEIVIPDDDFEGMEHILRLWVPIPTDTVAINEDNVESILPVANKYLMVQVVNKCDLKLAQMITDERLDAMRELVVQYRLPNLSIKCDELWKERMSTSDFKLALDGMSDGIRNREVNMINICLPLCIWRKDLISQLESRNVGIPKKLLLYFNDCLDCKLLPWNTNWRLVHDVTRSIYNYTAPIINPKEACYSCDEFSRSDQCPTCDNWLCQRCMKAHSPVRRCIQLNYRMYEITTNNSSFQSHCLACEDAISSYDRGDFERHIENNCSEKLNEKISWFLTHNNLSFDNIDWFVE